MAKELEMNLPIGKIVIGLIAVLIIIGLFSAFAIVGPGERGVLVTLGQVEPYSLGEGLHFKTPYIQEIRIINVQTQKVESGASAASKDLQIVSTIVALNFRIKQDQAATLFQNIGYDYISRVIDPAVQESVKATTANFTAEELITKRDVVKTEIEAVLKQRLNNYYIDVQSLSITNFEFSEAFNGAIEAKQVADQDAQKAERVLQQIKIEKEQTITMAEANNEKVKLEADAQAYATKVNADSEAYALQVVREQLSLNAKLIDYEAVQRWDGSVPQYMLGGGVIPFIDLQGGN